MYSRLVSNSVCICDLGLRVVLGIEPRNLCILIISLPFEADYFYAAVLAGRLWGFTFFLCFTREVFRLRVSRIKTTICKLVSFCSIPSKPPRLVPLFPPQSRAENSIFPSSAQGMLRASLC